MLIRRLEKGAPRRLTATGMMLMSAGLLLGRFGPRLLSPALSEGFWGGFLDGFGLVLLVASIPFNILGIVGMRRARRS